MSYLQGKKNMYSLLSSSIINHIKSQSLNDTLLKNQDIVKIEDSTKEQLFVSQPKSLIANSEINLNCGDTINCLTCLKNNNISDDMLKGENYNKNIDIINNLYENNCEAVCTCNIKYVNLSSNLLFSVGVNINSQAIDSQKIADDIYSRLMTKSKSTSSGTETNNSYYWLILGVPGAFGIQPDVDKESITESINKTVYNISQLYSNTINQLITSSQTIILSGTGIKAKNISLSTVQNIVMAASQQNCSAQNPDANLICVDDQISNITNELLQSAIKSMEYGTSILSYAYQQNKTLIWMLLGIFVVSAILFVYLTIHKALKK